MRRIHQLAALAAAIVFGVNCGGGSEPDEPKAGNLTVNLTTPNVDDAAIKVTITSPVAPTSITGAGGAQVFMSGAIGTTTTVIVTGDLTEGALLTLAVPDTRDDDDYSATVVQVASTTYALRPLTGYALDISK